MTIFFRGPAFLRKGLLSLSLASLVLRDTAILSWRCATAVCTKRGAVSTSARAGGGGGTLLVGTNVSSSHHGLTLSVQFLSRSEGLSSGSVYCVNSRRRFRLCRRVSPLEIFRSASGMSSSWWVFPESRVDWLFAFYCLCQPDF